MTRVVAQAYQMDPAQAVGPQVFRLVRTRIITGDLQPGTRVSEPEIAAGLGVSRQPVREAFIKLAEEGLVEIRPQRGTYIRKISVSQVLDARFVREAIEADVVKLVATFADPTVAKELRAQLALQTAALGRPAEQFIELDELFHRTLAQAAGRSYAWTVIEGLKSQMDRVRYISVRQFPMEKLIEQHTAVVSAIEAEDPDASEAAIRRHLQEILSDLPAITEGWPEFFDGAP